MEIGYKFLTELQYLQEYLRLKFTAAFPLPLASASLDASFEQ